MKRVMLASGNPGKLQELQHVLKGLPIELLPQPDDARYAVAETGTTFVENAIIKARHACAISRLPCIADDSGLMVDALDGHPGVKTARYAGPVADSADNMAKLLDALSGIDDAAQRGAQFCCVLVYMRHAQDPLPVIATATWRGQIATSQRGAGGFGYDPVFYLPELELCAAEMSADEKKARSHRGQAALLLARALAPVLGV